MNAKTLDSAEVVALKMSNGFGGTFDTVIYQLPLAWVETIKAIWEATDYDYYGVRIVEDGHKLRVGDTPANSYYQPDGEWTDEELDGTSAIAIKEYHYNPTSGSVFDIDRGIVEAIQDVIGYGGTQLLLLGSEGASEGNDPGELEMANATVLATFELYREEREPSNEQTEVKS